MTVFTTEAQSSQRVLGDSIYPFPQEAELDKPPGLLFGGLLPPNKTFLLCDLRVSSEPSERVVR